VRRTRTGLPDALTPAHPGRDRRARGHPLLRIGKDTRVTDDMSPGRHLLLELVDAPGLFDHLGPEDDLLSAGINSGELIKLALAIEERTGTALDDDVLATLYTIEGIDQVLAGAGVPAAAEQGGVSG